MVDVSVIIVNYNTESLLAASVESLYENTKGASFEIIVVDNKSRPESRERLKDTLSRYPGTRLVPLAENLGFGCANNAAVPFAEGDYILLLNPDTVLLNDAVSVMKDYLDSHGSVAACGGNLLDSEMRPATSFHRLFPSVIGELNSLLFYLPERVKYGKNRFFNHTGKPLDVAAITGADLMIRKSVVEKTGLFDESFFMYYEDTELCHRIRGAGYGIVSVPDARIQHLEGRSSSDMKRKADIVSAGRKNYYRVTGRGRLYTGVCNCLFFCCCLIRSLTGLVQGSSQFRYWSRMLCNVFS